MGKLSILVLSLFIIFISNYSTLSQNLCEICVKDGKIFYFNRNYEYFCVSSSEFQQVRFITSHSTVEECIRATTIITKRGKKTKSTHEYLIPTTSTTQRTTQTLKYIFKKFPPKSTQNKLEESQSTSTPAILTTSTLPVTLTKQTTVSSSRTPVKLEKEMESKTTLKILEPVFKSQGSSTTEIPIILSKNVSSEKPKRILISTKSSLPTVNPEKQMSQGKTTMNLEPVENIQGNSTTLFILSKDDTPENSKLMLMLMSNSTEFEGKANKTFCKSFYYTTIIIKLDTKFNFTSSWLWLSPHIITKYDCQFEKMNIKESRKFAELDEIEMQKLVSKELCKSYKYGSVLLESNPRDYYYLQLWLLLHPSHNEMFPCKYLEKKEFQLVNLYI